MRFLCLLLLVLLVPSVALAADTVPPDSPTLALPADQVWTVVAGSIVPLVMYVINKYMPYTSEKIKGIAQVVAAAVAGGIVQAITAGGVGFNSTTLQFVVTAVIAALAAHAGLWTRSGISTALGGGRNAQ